MGNMRNRAWRRKKTESKWNSRCKKFMFSSIFRDGDKEYSFNMSDVDGKKFRRTIMIPNLRRPTSWKEMKKLDPWARFLRNGSGRRTYVSDQMDAKHKVKLQRINNKKLINEGIQVYDETLEDNFYLNNVA